MDAQIFLILPALLNFLFPTTHAQRTIVPTDKGSVQGKSVYVQGKKVDVFYGIPYARPPVAARHPTQILVAQHIWITTVSKGELRFQHPQQLDPWTGVRDATEKPNCCMQLPDMTFGNFSGSTVWNPNTEANEDCLYLNVWTPRIRPPYHNKAVMVWIYGGAFLTGSSVLDIYDGKYLALENDVIVVSMQFRFGALGYLTLGNTQCPGNAALMDLRMALEWIQRNIHFFGGNAHNVTLVGESSGAVSIGLLMLSSLGRGLFHRAILQSGAPQAPWGTFSLKEGRRRSLALAKRLGCDVTASDTAILACLRKIPAIRFPEEETRVAEGVAQFPFLPVIDGTFLTKTPAEYLRAGEFKKIPIMLGSNANEGSWLLVYAEPHYFNLDTPSLVSSESYSHVMDSLFRYHPQYPQPLNDLAKDAIKFRYRDWLDPQDQVRLRNQVAYAVGDFHFTCSVADLAKTASQHGQDVYVYRFSHRMSQSPWPQWMGVLHGDEIFFVFGQPLNTSLDYTPEERELSLKMMKFWTNFAKTGNPNRAPGELEVEEWPKFRHDQQFYLDINLDLLQSGSSWGQGVRPQHCAFWDNYIPELSGLATSPLSANCTRTSAATSAASPVALTSMMLAFSLVVCCLSLTS